MKIKLLEVLAELENIKSIQEVKLPVKVSYRIKRLVDKLQPLLNAYEEKRVELVKEFGEKQEDNTYKVTDSQKLKDFRAKINELQEIEEEIDFEKIPIDMLGDMSLEPCLIISFIFE